MAIKSPIYNKILFAAEIIASTDSGSKSYTIYSSCIDW